MAFFNCQVIAKNNGTDGIFFKVENKAIRAILKLKHLTGHCIFKAMQPGDTVTNLNDSANLTDIKLRFISFNLFLDD